MSPTRTSQAAKPAEQPAPQDSQAPAVLHGVDLRPELWETWPIERIKANVRNARKHPKKQIEELRGSLREFGQVWPLLVREDGTLICGHGRLEAMRHEALAQVRVIVARGWSEKQCRAFALLDNKMALNSEWDEDLLGMEIKDLRAQGVDPATLGFDPKELAKLAPPPPVSNENEAKPEGRTLKAVIQYNVVFDDETQQQAWFAFIKRLKLQYPDDETLGRRLAKFIAALPVPPPAGTPPKPEGANAAG